MLNLRRGSETNFHQWSLQVGGLQKLSCSHLTRAGMRHRAAIETDLAVTVQQLSPTILMKSGVLRGGGCHV